MSPAVDDAVPPAPASRVVEARVTPNWNDSSRPADLPTSTGAEGSLFDRLPAVSTAPRSAFDVCHVGVVLRAVLLVQSVVAIGAAFAASATTPWLTQYAMHAGAALAGTLLWLLSICALARHLDRARDPLQTVVAAGLGAIGAAAGAALFSLASPPGPDAPAPGLWPPMLAGAALGAALAHWIRLRHRTALPADTTARLAELQSRIRPHFLFNTLNTAMALVRVDARLAEDLLADLAELFRVALMPGGESVSLADEIDLAQRYLAIEQVRFGERLAVQWELDDAASSARVPPLLLQPLLENAVRHGIEPAPKGGTIRVRTRVRGSQVLLSIVNTVPPEPSQPGHGIALRNVRERLLLMHDVAAQFDARRDGNLFRVQLVLPAAA